MRQATVPGSRFRLPLCSAASQCTRVRRLGSRVQIQCGQGRTTCARRGRADQQLPSQRNPVPLPRWRPPPQRSTTTFARHSARAVTQFARPPRNTQTRAAQPLELCTRVGFVKTSEYNTMRSSMARKPAHNTRTQGSGVYRGSGYQFRDGVRRQYEGSTKAYDGVRRQHRAAQQAARTQDCERARTALRSGGQGFLEGARSFASCMDGTRDKTSGP
jgi:hypothetical protein